MKGGGEERAGMRWEMRRELKRGEVNRKDVPTLYEKRCNAFKEEKQGEGVEICGEAVKCMS